jgi:DNA-binding NtrC family response regulator
MKADDMNQNLILHISDRANSSNSALAALKEVGYEIVSTNSPAEGVALLYIMPSVAAVVLDNPAREHASFDVAQKSLRTIRPSVPVMQLCGDQIDRCPSWADECVGTDKLTSELQHLLTAEPVVS